MAWLDTANAAVFRALCAVFALDPDGSEAASRFRCAYTGTAVTHPQADRERDVCYYTVTETSDPALAHTRRDYALDEQGRMTVRIHKVLPLSCLLTFYGPNADEDAEACWSGLFADYGHGSPPDVLRQSGLSLVSWPDRPLSLPELQGSLWRRRCDLRVGLRMRTVQTVRQRPDAPAPAKDVAQSSITMTNTREGRKP